MFFEFSGHLFDSKAINLILDCLIDKYDCFAAITKWDLGHGTKKHSSCTINVKKSIDFHKMTEDIYKICKEKEIMVTKKIVDI